MTTGTMEVTVVRARDLKNTELFGKVDPYVVITYNNQEQKSTTGQPKTSESLMHRCLWFCLCLCLCLRGQGGRRAVWNEKFKFRVEYPVPGAAHQQPKLLLKLMDHDNFTNDDDLGQATIYLKEVFELGLEKGHAELPTQKYRVVDADKTYRGEIEIGITYVVNGEVDQQNMSVDERKFSQS